MKLKIHSKWKWLGVDEDETSTLFSTKPKYNIHRLQYENHTGQDFEMLGNTLVGLKKGALYKRNGEEWIEV